MVNAAGRAPYAAEPALSRGRLHAEPRSASRNDFRRDADRIIHSTAFRRLKHKTQVFVFHEGDHYRTRLTHTLEVTQIARAIARALGLDKDLAEALALAHDLGHTPFGHAGERALARCLADAGGFDHNAQTLHVLTALERRYAAFDGLNLTWESLEGLVKHNGPLVGRDGTPVGRYRERGVPHAIKNFLYPRMYRHPRIARIMTEAEGVICDLFARYAATPADLPGEWLHSAGDGLGSDRKRLIADFIAGMTDRYALIEHARLFKHTPELR